MKISGQMFNSYEEAEKFWIDSNFDVMDIAIGLRDLGLNQESLIFSLQFAEPSSMQIYSAFKFNFEGIKKLFGVPEIYVDRSLEIKENPYEMEEPRRDAKTLGLNKDEVKKRFDVFIEELGKEKGRMAKELQKVQDQLLKVGALKKEDLQDYEAKSYFAEQMKKAINAKQTKEDENK